jgi:SH3-like domain-containing protein
MIRPMRGSGMRRKLDATGIGGFARRCLVVVALLVAGWGFDAIAAAETATDANPSGLPIPRFVSLRSNEVNLRTGPGLTYPIDWIYQRTGMPVEVVEEFDTWRKIRDWEGTEGWVHQSMLDGKRTFVVIGTEIQWMRLAPENDARPAARLSAGVVGDLMECGPVWCRATVQGYHGWIERNRIFGVLPNETF